METLISREEAKALVEKHMKESKDNVGSQKPKETNNWHYGRCEINLLLDAIYGPKTDA